MKHVSSHQLSAHVGEQVTIQGWIQTVRTLKTVQFIVVRDRQGTVQVVCTQPHHTQPLEESKALAESVIEVTATVQSNPKSTLGFELVEPTIRVLCAVTEPTPVPMSRKTLNASLPTLLEHAPTTLRHPSRRAVFKLSAAAMRAFRETLNAEEFTEIQTPKLVASATESGSNVFEIQYFGRKAYLAQSPQFYKQTMVGVFERVYEVAPVFRAEPHATRRHINTYTSLDVELGFIENHTTVMEQLTRVLRGIFAHMQTTCTQELETLQATLPHVPETIPRIHFQEARTLLAAEFGPEALTANDLSPEHERWLGTWAKREHASDFLFVTGYPMSKRPFYTHPQPSNPTFSNSFDLLFRGLELVTGGQRLHLYQDYLNALERAELPLEPFTHYLEAFRYGMPPHGGFAIGLERLIMQLIQAPNLRLTTLFPRDIHRLTP